MTTYMEIMRDTEARLTSLMRAGGGYIGVMTCSFADNISQATSSLISSQDLVEQEGYEGMASELILRVLLTKIQDLAEMIAAIEGEKAEVEGVRKDLEDVARKWIPVLEGMSFERRPLPILEEEEEEQGPLQ
jgi:hypothetical protein